MQEINWDHFNSKFSGRKQKAFETLCYQLFCKKYDKPLGIDRYENHAGIETDPIKVDTRHIGWQAKYYDSRLSEHKQELIDSITTAKKRHPKLTDIEFFLNKGFGQDRKKTDPQYKIDIETHAKNLGVAITWRGPSFFESKFVTDENSTIAKHYFSLENSVHDLIKKLTEQTQSILKPIRSDIQFKKEQIKIDRGSHINSIVECLSKFPSLVISGNGGSGKTAIIKDFYATYSPEYPIYCFKATDFDNRRSIDELFKDYGNFGLDDFTTAFPNIETKIVVIDSAERLSEIADKTVFNQFVDALHNNGWKIIFTTRRNYVGDLTVSLVNLYGLSFSSIDIPELSEKELADISQTYKFKIPDNGRLANLIRNPFYLHEYLQYYDENKSDHDYQSFREKLWKKQIVKSEFTNDNIHLDREAGFIKLAVKRANEGGFSVDPGNEITSKALSYLQQDEVVAFDDKTGGYFVTHDVYEEWALDKFIERSFNSSNDTEGFFATLGDSRPVRRAFRSWLSDKLLTSKQEASSLIKETLSTEKVPNHWKDEVLVSSLLSDYSEELLSSVESELLNEDGQLLSKIIFLLRIACKDIDEEHLHRLGADRFKAGSLLGSLYTVPKGSGWRYVIKFIYKNKKTLGLKNWTHILNLLKDWNSRNKSGDTTKYATKTALFYYESIADEDALYSLKDLEKKLVEAILNGASEIKDELSKIIDSIITDTNFSHRSRYYPITKYMLGSILESTDVSNAIPSEIIKLAEYIWLLPKPDDLHGIGRSRIDIDDDFSLNTNVSEYYPSSSLQTPLAVLLNAKQTKTLEFLTRLVNKSVSAFLESDLSKNETEEITLKFADGREQKQVIGPRLWEMYRGTHVAPNLLESIHMALEKWLLVYVASASKEDAVNVCLKLLKDSESASITAVVTSAVISQPFKLGQVAIVLFRTKELFFYEKTRLLKDRTQKSSLESLRDNFPTRDYIDQIHQNERINACDEKHRTMDLENLAVYYQFFRPEGISEKESEKLVKQIWDILDEYYSGLPPKKAQKESDKTWRLYLARMDKRKMKPKAQQKDGQTLISFNPEIDTELKKYSEDALEENNKSLEHTKLNLWSRYKWDKKDDYDKENYKEYDEDIKKIVSETKVIIRKLKQGDEHVGFFEFATPTYVTGVLMRDYKDQLSTEEINWCAGILLDVASLPLQDGYKAQAGDGVDVAVRSLPYLTGINKKIDEKVTELLLFSLFNLYPIGGSQTLSDMAVATIIHNLWKESPEISQSILAGYIELKPFYVETREKVRQENLKNKKYETSEKDVIDRLKIDHSKDIDRVLSRSVKIEDIEDGLSTLGTSTLATIFELIPYRTEDPSHKKLAQITLNLLAKKISDREKERHFVTYNIFVKITHFILTSDKADVEQYIKPFIDNFDSYNGGSDLLEAFLSAADKLGDSYENFWHVWDQYYLKVLEISKRGHLTSWDITVIHNYLFAWMYFKEDAREWHILKEEDHKFFEKVVSEFGSPVTVLYSLAKILYDVGSSYLEYGITWLSDLINNNPELEEKDWEVNTLYHLEYALKRYVIRNREKIRKNRRLKNRILTILNIMINKGSIFAYLMREDIL